MAKYKDLYKWMLLPLVLMQAGIFADYWGDFTDNAWSVHIHYWTGTLWYLYLIIQPYYATHGQMEKHRTNGIIGMFLAGGVCLTAFSMMYRDIRVADFAAANPERMGPFEPWFFFGVMAIEIPMILAFGFAVIQSIRKRKKLEDHAWWLVSTVFIIMMPAFSRGTQLAYVGLNAEHWPDIDIMFPIYGTQAMIILLAILAAWKYEKLRHPATFLMVGINLYNCLLEPLGRWESLQQFFRTIITG
ncbi:MAG: hypothetical protein AAFR61_07745 [Bacteroidota bacterium]